MHYKVSGWVIIKRSLFELVEDKEVNCQLQPGFFCFQSLARTLSVCSITEIF